MIKNVYRSSCKVPVFCQILIKLELSPQIFEKYLNINFHENSFTGSRVVPSGRTDRRRRYINKIQQDATVCRYLFTTYSAAGKFMSMKNSNDTIGNRSRDLRHCVPQKCNVPLGITLNVKI